MFCGNEKLTEPTRQSHPFKMIKTQICQAFFINDKNEKVGIHGMQHVTDKSAHKKWLIDVKKKILKHYIYFSIVNSEQKCAQYFLHKTYRENII